VSDLVAFAGVLAATVGWIALPLLPAFRELTRPRDASPLDAVGQDSADLTYFADSFRQFVAQQGFVTAAEGTLLPDGRMLARLAAAATPDAAALDARCGLLLAEPGAGLPAGRACGVEVYGAGDLVLGERSTARAAFAEGQLTLAPQSTTVRWAHGERALTAGDGAVLLGRASSRGPVALGREVQFERILAPYIVVGAASAAPTSLARNGWERSQTLPVYRLARAAAVLASQHWLVDDDLVIPNGHRFRGSLVVRGTITIGAGCEIRGSLKGHRAVAIGVGAVVTGAVASRRDIVLGVDARVHGPVIAEGRVTLRRRASVGQPTAPASVSAEHIELETGAEVFGSVAARLSGRTSA
jgi:cytoskeletal protein CcmA (bactofilin family)